MEENRTIFVLLSVQVPKDVERKINVGVCRGSIGDVSGNDGVRFDASGDDAFANDVAIKRVCGSGPVGLEVPISSHAGAIRLQCKNHGE